MKTIPTTPVKGRSAWRVEDLEKDTSWLRMISEDDLADIDRFVGDVGTAIRDWPALRAYEWSQNASLPETCKGILEEVQNGFGITVLRGLPVDRHSVSECETALAAIGACLGDATPQNLEGDVVGHVTDLGSDFKGDPDARGYTSSQELMPHADGCDILGLFCVQKAASGGLSMLVSSMSIFNEILARRPDLLPLCFRGFYHDLRKESVPDGGTGVSRTRWPVFVYQDGFLSAGYNAKTIRNAPLKGAPPLTADELELLDLFEEIAKSPALEYKIQLEPGDILFANNRTVMHSRTSFIDNAAEGMRRLMLRLWINVDDPRPLPDSVLAIARGGITSKTGTPETAEAG